MLRAAANIAPRAVFVCGNTSTTAGLTVSVSREASSSSGGGSNVTLEAGALVLADQGVCCIDELDKCVINMLSTYQLLSTFIDMSLSMIQHVINRPLF